MTPENFMRFLMQRSTKFGFLLLIVSVLLMSSGCSASKKNSCGCPNKKGMVGY